VETVGSLWYLLISSISGFYNGCKQRRIFKKVFIRSHAGKKEVEEESFKGCYQESRVILFGAL